MGIVFGYSLSVSNADVTMVVVGTTAVETAVTDDTVDMVDTVDTAVDNVADTVPDTVG